jgi:prevent-host-death family protein
MVTITAAELVKQFGLYRDLARKEPVSVTHHGRESVVVLSAEEYKRLKSYDDREVFAARDIPGDLVEELKKPISPYKTDLDHLMK